ncbi:MAG: Zn-dependent hydrolase [Clostridium butyricum]|nr:Zn-dependent hydrolase [Clostridium butyricum]
MQIFWYGHSCFLIKTNTGKRILMEPFESNIEYNINFPKCDVTTLSHNHFSNSYIDKVGINTKLLNHHGTFDMNTLKVYGITTFCDKLKGAKRGKNIIFIFKIENYTICHLGNLGHIPDINILDRLQGIDILFIPISSQFTLDPIEASHLCDLILPKYIIPMNYKTLDSSIPLNDLEKFLFCNKNIYKINSSVLNIDDLKLKSLCNIILMNTYS